jgi:hypothetical protein
MCARHERPHGRRDGHDRLLPGNRGEHQAREVSNRRSGAKQTSVTGRAAERPAVLIVNFANQVTPTPGVVLRRCDVAALVGRGLKAGVRSSGNSPFGNAHPTRPLSRMNPRSQTDQSRAYEGHEQMACSCAPMVAANQPRGEPTVRQQRSRPPLRDPSATGPICDAIAEGGALIDETHPETVVTITFSTTGVEDRLRVMAIRS